MTGVGSCRFLFVDFTSDRGDFSDMYTDPTADGPPVQYRAGVGLFTWLQPFDNSNWSDGQCTGYNQVQLSHITDDYFEIARIFAVFSVLAGIGISIWTLFLSCLSMSRCQVIVMSLVFFAMIIFAGLSGVVFLSRMCTNALVAFQSENYTASCTVDQGGLVIVAASILWCVSFLLTVIYIKPPESDVAIVNGQIQNVFDSRMEKRKKQREKQLQKLMADQQKAKLASIERQKQLDQLPSKQKQRQSPRQKQGRQQSPSSQQMDSRDLQLSRTGSSTPPQPTPINRLASPIGDGSGGLSIFPAGGPNARRTSPPGAYSGADPLVPRIPMMMAPPGVGIPSPSGAVQAYRSPRSPSGVLATSGKRGSKGNVNLASPSQLSRLVLEKMRRDREEQQEDGIEVQVPRSSSRMSSARSPGGSRFSS